MTGQIMPMNEEARDAVQDTLFLPDFCGIRMVFSMVVAGELLAFVLVLAPVGPGIGDWTAQYIAMRALGEPDAFPAADLGIIKALQEGGTRPTPKQVRRRAEAWRPWRAYAAIYLWRA